MNVLIFQFCVFKEAELEQKRSERHGTLKTCKVIALVIFTRFEMVVYVVKSLM